MRNPKTTQTKPVPPQLLGVLDDAVPIGASSFRLEVFPTHIMASFSTQSRAMEIDFEMEAGQEMMDYLTTQATAGGKGLVPLEHAGRRLDCRVTFDKRRRPSWVEVSWG